MNTAAVLLYALTCCKYFMLYNFCFPYRVANLAFLKFLNLAFSERI